MRDFSDDEPVEDASVYDGSVDDEIVERPHGVRFGEGQKRGRGRPPGSPNRSTIVKRVANKRHKIRKDGRARRLSTLELVLEVLRAEALQGNLRAFELQEKLVTRYAEQAKPRRATVFACSNKLTEEEWSAVYGLPRLADEEVLAKFPYLKYAIKGRGRDPDQPVLT